jgi:hypothetical protein
LAWGTFIKKHWQTALHWVVVGAAFGYLAWLIPGLVGQADEAFGSLDHLRWGWLFVAVPFGVSALVVYGELHRQLLLVGGARLSVPTVQGINFVENAVSTTIPVVGGAGAILYAIDQLRRRKVDSALASWSVLVAGVIATLSLLVLGSVGLGVVGRIPLALGIALALVIALGAVGAWKLLTHPEVLRHGVRGLVLVAQWVPGVCKTCRDAWAERADQVSRRLSARLTVLQPSGLRWLGLIAIAASTWVLDFLSLAASVAAVGASVPWGGLLVGFLLVQASIALQIFPGGAGLAETSLLALLLASGVPAAQAAASVLIYRLITWLGLALLGWLVYALWIHTAPLHLHRHAPELTPV